MPRRRYNDGYDDGYGYNNYYQEPPQGGLLNFSPFTPTFIGKPVNEMAGAMQAFRQTGDAILDTEDALGQVLAQSQVDPKDIGILVNQKNMLDQGIKDIAASGDFGPARIKMRSLLTKFNQDGSRPAAEARYQTKLQAITDANKLASELKISPQTLSVKLQRIEDTFTPTTKNPITGNYDRNYIPPPLEEDFDFHTFLSQFMSNKQKSLVEQGYTPYYGDIPIDETDPNSSTTRRLIAFRKGAEASISVTELEDEAIRALEVNGKVKPTSRDLSQYYGTSEHDVLKKIVRPYAELFGVSQVTADYDKIFEYDKTNPQLDYNRAMISRGAQIKNPLTGGIDQYAAAYTTQGAPNMNTYVGGLSPAPQINQPNVGGFGYNIPSIINDPIRGKMVDRILRKDFNTSLADLSKKDPTNVADKQYVDNTLNKVNDVLKSFAKNNIVNDPVPLTTPAESAYSNWEMFSQEKPTLTYHKDGEVTGSIDLENATIVDDATKKKLTWEEFKKQSNPGVDATVELIPRGQFQADNSLAAIMNDQSLLKARMYNINGKNYIIGTTSIPIYESDKMESELGKLRYTAGYEDDFPFIPDTKAQANYTGITSDGRPQYNYTIKTGITGLNDTKAKILNNIGSPDKIPDILKTIKIDGDNLLPSDIAKIEEYIYSGITTVDNPQQNSLIFEVIQDMINNPKYK